MDTRWEHELNNPEPYAPIYLSASSLKNLRYTLGHAVSNDVTLSEAVDQLCDGWFSLFNQQVRCERRHQPYEELISKKIAKAHRKCTTAKCKRDDWMNCPIYEY